MSPPVVATAVASLSGEVVVVAVVGVPVVSFQNVWNKCSESLRLFVSSFSFLLVLHFLLFRSFLSFLFFL